MHSRILPGTVIAERFQISQLVGHGGMGTVYRARDLDEGEWVAVKILKQDSAQVHELRRFSREATLLAESRHPAIPAYVASGLTEAGLPYLVMEWLQGETLERRLERGLLPVADCQRLLERVAEVLTCVHRMGVVHRDIKPSNLFLCEGRLDRVVVLDFGIAHFEHARGLSSLTADGELVGTLEYMAPEQVSPNGTISPATDVYALGLVAYEGLVGTQPQTLRHAAAALARTLYEVDPPLAKICPRVPESLSALIERMLAKDPLQRPADGAVLGQLLQGLGPLRDRGDSAASQPASCNGPELRLHSLVLAAEPALHTPQPSFTSSETRQDLVETLTRLGGHPSFLLDGSLLLRLSPMDSAHDQAIKAARCALLIKARWPLAEVAVATGRGQATEQSILGDVVERAAELLRTRRTLLGDNVQLTTTAAAGGVWVDGLSASLLDRSFVVIPLDGCGLLTGESTSSEFVRPVLGTHPPCLGRENELSVLDSILAHCRLESQSQSVLITAPAGSGKTRLRQEFAVRAQRRSQPPMVLLGIGQLLAAGAPYSLLSAGLRRLCGIVAEMDSNRACQRLLDTCTELLGTRRGPKDAAFLARICGLQLPDPQPPELRAACNDPRIMMDHIQGALTDLLSAYCARIPVLWIFDDLQWGDPISIGLLGGLLRDLESSAFMVLALGRPEVKHLFPAVREWPSLKQWPLSGLNRAASERLIRFVCGDHLEASAVERIVKQAEGNPLLLEELIRAAARKDGLPFPDTALAMLQARLQQLDPATHLMLGRASIFGERFSRGGLQALLPSLAIAETDAMLQRLIKAEFINTPSRSTRPDDVEYRFRHALLCEAAYSLVSDEQKQQWHTCAAEHLVRSGGSDDLVLAEHWSRSSEPYRAARHLARAAARLLEGSSLSDARRLVEKGLSCQEGRWLQLDSERVVRGELLGTYATILWRSFELEASLAAGEEALTLLPQGHVRWCQAFHATLTAAMLMGRHEAIRGLAGRFHQIAPPPEGMVSYVESGVALLSMYCLIGHRVAARATFMRMEQMTGGASIEDPVVETWLQFGLYLMLRMLEGNLALAWSAVQRAASAAARTQNRRWICLVEARAALCELDLGMPSAEERMRGANRIVGELSEEAANGHVPAGLSLILAQKIEHGEEATRIAEAVLVQYRKSPVICGIAQLALANVHTLSGALDAAEEAARAAVQLFSTTPPLQLGARAQLIRILLAGGQLEPARSAAGQALATLQELGGTGWSALAVRLGSIKVKLAGGEIEGARIELRAAVDTLRAHSEQIPDVPMRQQFLSNIRENVELLALAREQLEDLPAGSRRVTLRPVEEPADS